MLCFTARAASPRLCSARHPERRGQRAGGMHGDSAEGALRRSGHVRGSRALLRDQGYLKKQQDAALAPEAKRMRHSPRGIVALGLVGAGIAFLGPTIKMSTLAFPIASWSAMGASSLCALACFAWLCALLRKKAMAPDAEMRATLDGELKNSLIALALGAVSFSGLACSLAYWFRHQ